MTMELILIIVLGVIVIALVGMYFSYNNKEINLRKEAEAQLGVIESVHDKMWKVIKQKANVTEKYRDTFEKIYPELISGRYGNSMDSFKWIKEDNPDFNVALFQDLMQAIEVQRSHLHNAQTRMLDVIRERESLIENYPSRWFVSNKQPIDYEVISSTKTKALLETAIDDEIEMFENK